MPTRVGHRLMSSASACLIDHSGKSIAVSNCLREALMDFLSCPSEEALPQMKGGVKPW